MVEQCKPVTFMGGLLRDWGNTEFCVKVSNRYYIKAMLLLLWEAK